MKCIEISFNQCEHYLVLWYVTHLIMCNYNFSCRNNTFLNVKFNLCGLCCLSWLFAAGRGTSRHLLSPLWRLVLQWWCGGRATAVIQAVEEVAIITILFTAAKQYRVRVRQLPDLTSPSTRSTASSAFGRRRGAACARRRTAARPPRCACRCRRRRI